MAHIVHFLTSVNLNATLLSLDGVKPYDSISLRCLRKLATPDGEKISRSWSSSMTVYHHLCGTTKEDRTVGPSEGGEQDDPLNAFVKIRAGT